MGRVRCCIVMETVWFVFLGDVSWLLLTFFSINFTYLVVFLRRITLFYCKKVHVTTGCLSDLDTTSNSRDLFKFCFVVIYQQYGNSIIFSSFLTKLCYILPIVKSQQKYLLLYMQMQLTFLLSLVRIVISAICFYLIECRSGYPRPLL